MRGSPVSSHLNGHAAILNCVSKCMRGENREGMRCEDVLESIFQNARVICTNTPPGISNIAGFAIDSFVIYVLYYT